MIRKQLDSALDFMVLPGYTTLGHRLRRRWWDRITPERLVGRRFLVTGASSGIGEAACVQLVDAGAKVDMLVRSPGKGEAARKRIAAAGGTGEAELWLCDLSDLDEIRRFAAAYSERVDSLDGIVHNAGVLTAEREFSPQAHELTFATHVLGPFLLTSLLKASLKRDRGGDVVFVSSGGMYTTGPDLSDIELERRPFDGSRFYAHAKRLQVLLAAEWARRERGSGVSFSSLHPGWVDTPGLEASLPGFRRLMRSLLLEPGEGADTTVWLLATGAGAEHPGAFWHDRRPRPEHRVPWTREKDGDGPRLWAELARRAGVTSSAKEFGAEAVR